MEFGIFFFFFEDYLNSKNRQKTWSGEHGDSVSLPGISQLIGMSVL